MKLGIFIPFFAILFLIYIFQNKYIEKMTNKICGRCLPLVTQCNDCWSNRHKKCEKNTMDKRCKKKSPCYDKEIFGKRGTCEEARKCVSMCEKTHGPYELYDY
jgi:hypothetical protein